MATTTMTTVSNILKEVYENDGVHDQLESGTTTLKRIERTSEGVTHTVGGKYVRFPIRTRRNHGIGARNEMEPLPVAQTQAYESAQVKLKYLYGSAQLSGQTLELADKDYQAFSAALEEEMSGLDENLKRDLNRQVYGDGSGKLAVATDAGSTTTLVTTDDRFLEEGMIVDIYSSADAVIAAGAVITNVETVGGVTTATFSPAASGATAAGTYMTRKDARNKEITGFGKIIDNKGTLYDINGDNVSVWRSYVDDNNGTPRPVSEALMTRVATEVRRKGGTNATVIFSADGVQRAYFNLLSQQRRITNTKQFDGGYEGLGFFTDNGEIPLVLDFDAPAGTMQFVNEKQLKIYQAGEWKFLDRDGSKWKQVTDSSGSYDAYYCTKFKYMEIGTHRRNAHGILKDLIEQ